MGEHSRSDVAVAAVDANSLSVHAVTGVQTLPLVAVAACDSYDPPAHSPIVAQTRSDVVVGANIST